LFCIDKIEEAVTPGNPEEVALSMKQWLTSVKAANVIALYVDLNDFLVDRNGYVTETNKMIANATGSSTNAILLGNTQQSRASLFYISSYITKNKMSLEHCLSALSRAQAHIEKYPSKTEDAGTKKCTIQHLMQRVLNTMYCHRELSDTQVALALMNGLGAEATSDSFSYYGAAYMNNFIDAELEHNCRNNTATGGCSDECHNPGEADSQDDGDGDSSLGECLTDRWGSIPTASTAQLGPAPFKKRQKEGAEEGEMESIPVHYQLHWRFRGKELAMMTAAEYYGVIAVVPLSKKEMRASTEDENYQEGTSGDNEDGAKKGRVANKTFPFDPAHPLHRSHTQRLYSKQVTMIHNGFAPKYPGPMPECPETGVEDFKRHFKVWKGKADAFAKYYLCTFRPMEEVYSGEHKISNRDDFTWEALCGWVQSMEASPRLVDHMRVAAMFNHIYGFRSKSKHSEVLNMYRMRKRTLWSEEQKAENRELYSGFKTYRQDMKEADEVGDEFGGCSSHVFRTQDVTEVYKEVRYCSEQMKALDFIFKNVGEGAGQHTASSEYISANHPVIAQCYAAEVQSRSNALHSARPKKLTELSEDYGAEGIGDPSASQSIPSNSQPNNNHQKKPQNAQEQEDIPSATEYLNGRELSIGQRRVIDRFREYFERIGTVRQRLHTEVDAPMLLMTGDPGAGKSYVIETLVELAYLMEAGHAQTTSFNGIAAVNIDGTTLCRLLSIPTFTATETDFAKAHSSLKGDQLQAVRNDLEADKLVLFIVDEVSTLDSVMVAMIDARLQKVMGNTKPFGGIAMLFCGDFNQLGVVQKTFLLDDLIGWAEYQEHLANQIQDPSQGGDSNKRKNTAAGAKCKPKRASVQKMMRISLQQKKKAQGKKEKEINKSLYSRYAVRGMVHRGCNLFSGLERYHLEEQWRAKDPVHMNFLKKLAAGLDISWRDLKAYKALDRADAQEKEWQFAPVLVSTN